MEIILKNFIYNGIHIEEFKCTLPSHLNDVDTIPTDKCVGYIKELLELYTSL